MKQLFKHFFCVLLLALLMPITAVAQIDYGCWGTITVYLLETTTVTSQYDIPSGYEWKVKSMVWSSEKYSDSPYGDSYEIISQNGKTCEIKGRSFASSGKLYCKMKYGETDYIAYYNVNAISKGNLSISANPSGGTVSAGTKVYLTCNEVSGASIFYTTDGTDPIYNSNTFQPVNGSLYNSSGITINQTTTLKAFAAKKGYTSSQTNTWQYTVNVLVTSITLNKTSLSLQTGQEETLTATVKPDNATNKTVTWSSSNTNVATVTAGKVTTKSAGTATITCTANDGSGVKATRAVTVTNPVIKVTSITLNKSSLSLQQGQEETLTAAVKPDNATNKTVTWSSSPTGVVTVDNGKVKAVTAGTTTITCRANDGSGVYAICAVTVTSPLKKGDVNGDGETNGTDIVAMTNMILGKTEKKAAADLNGDGEVNGTDYVMLVNIVLGK